jgi:hypothetical protein
MTLKRGPGGLLLRGPGGLLSRCCCGPAPACCGWSTCPDPDTFNGVPFTLYGGISGSGLTPYIFSSICDPGPPLLLKWVNTGLSDSLGIYCEDGAFVLRYECPPAAVTFEATLTVVSCDPFIAHASITWSHSSGFGECEIDIDGDFYVLQDAGDLP